MQFPVKMTHPHHANPNKVITARNEEELEALLRIGWVAKPEPKTIEGGPARLAN